MPAGPIRLDHGGGQSTELSPLAEMASHSEAGAVRGHRPPRTKPLRRGQCGRPSARPRPHSGMRRRQPSLPEAAGLDLSARPQITTVLHRVARPAPARGNWRPRRRQTRKGPRVESVERSNYLDHGPKTSRGGCYERKGKQPLSKPALSRASRHMPEPVSRRPSAKETLRIVLARLDDMKAEDSVTIDLTGKSTIGDFMVVTSGRSNVHVAAIADNLVKDLKARRHYRHPRRRFAARRLGADRRRRCDRPRVPAGSSQLLQLGKDVVVGPPGREAI